MLLKNMINEFLKAQVGTVSDATRAWYVKRLHPLCALGDVPIDGAIAERLRDVWVGLTAKKERWSSAARRPAQKGGLSPWTLDGYYRAWRALFNWCVHQEYIERSPMKKLKRPSLPEPEPKTIDEADLLRLFDVARQSWRDYAVVCFLTSTGCRLGGITGCMVHDVDLQSGRVKVIEKGRGGGKQRTVYLTDAALDALKGYFYFERRWGMSDSLFVSDDGKCGLQSNGIRSLLRRLASRAGVVGRVNPHAFRHRFARNLLTQGCDLGSVRQLMGHKDPSVTVKFYGRWADDELRRTHAKYLSLPER